MLRYSDRRQLQSTRVFSLHYLRMLKDTCFTQEVFILFLSSRSTFVSLSRSIRIRIVSTEQVRQLIAYALCSFSTEEFLWQSPHGITHRYRHRGHGSLLVARGHRYKNAHNFVISDQVPETFYTSSRYYNLPTPVCLYVRFSFPLNSVLDWDLHLLYYP